MERAKQAAGSEPLLQLAPLKPKKYGVVTTGNEVFYGRITDKSPRSSSRSWRNTLRNGGP